MRSSQIRPSIIKSWRVRLLQRVLTKVHLYMIHLYSPIGSSSPLDSLNDNKTGSAEEAQTDSIPPQPVEVHAAGDGIAITDSENEHKDEITTTNEAKVYTYIDTIIYRWLGN